MNKIVKMIHRDRELRDAIIEACKKDGAPLKPQALNQWKKLRYGVPPARVQTVARVMKLRPYQIRPDIFPRTAG